MRLLRPDASHELVVHHHHRRLGACPQTSVVLERGVAVWCVALVAQTEGILDGAEDLLRTTEVARGAPADLQDVSPGWGEPEVGVEGGHGPDIVGGGAVELRDLLHGLGRDVAQGVLDSQEGGEDCNVGLLLVSQRLAVTALVARSVGPPKGSLS